MEREGSEVQRELDSYRSGSISGASGLDGIEVSRKKRKGKAGAEGEGSVKRQRVSNACGRFFPSESRRVWAYHQDSL